MLERRLAEIKAEKIQIRTKLNSGEEVNLIEVKAKLDSLETEERSIADKLSLASKITDIKIEDVKIIKKDGVIVEDRKFETMTKEEILNTPEYRSAFFKALKGERFTELETRAMTVGTGGGADAAVPTTTLDQIITKLVQITVLFPLIKKSFVPGNLTVVVQGAVNNADWHQQGVVGTAKDAGTGKVSLNGYELIRLISISRSALSMTISAFEAYIVDEIVRRLSVAIENAILNGTGSTNTQPDGIIAIITGQALITKAGLKYLDMLAILGSLPTMYHQNATLVMTRALLFGDVAGCVDNYGRPIFVLDPTKPFAYTVMGYPVTIDDYCPVDTMVFGDLSFYQMNFSQGVQIEKSLEYSFAANMVDYKGTAIVDGKVLLAEAFVVATRKLT